MTSGAGFTPDYYARQDRFAQSEKYQRELARLAELMDLRFGMLVLDIGCGTGRGATHFEQQHECTVVRLDAPAGWLEAPPPHRAVRGDGHHLPFADDTFDAVYLAHSLGHVTDPDAVLAEAARVAKPGARLAAVTPNRRFVRSLRPLNHLRIIRYVPDPTVRTVFSLRRLVSAATAAGWTVEQANYAGALPDHLRWLPRGALADGLRERLFLGARRKQMCA